MNSVKYIKHEIENEIEELRNNISSFYMHDEEACGLTTEENKFYEECLKSFWILEKLLGSLKQIYSEAKMDEPEIQEAI